jgi:hypothetical protein
VSTACYVSFLFLGCDTGPVAGVTVRYGNKWVAKVLTRPCPGTPGPPSPWIHRESSALPRSTWTLHHRLIEPTWSLVIQSRGAQRP